MVTTRLLTAEDLYALGPDARFELIEGEMMEYSFHGGCHGATTGSLTAWIGEHLRINPIGTLYASQVGCVLQRNPDTVLAPDLAFIHASRLGEQPDDGFLLVIPDFVAEVRDPRDAESGIEQKIRIYLVAGVEQVWVVDPFRQELFIHQADEPVSVFGYDDIVTGGGVLPGFALRVGDLFE